MRKVTHYLLMTIVLVLAVSGVRAEQVPPKVISTVPMDGAVLVDPSTDIRIQLDPGTWKVRADLIQLLIENQPVPIKIGVSGTLIQIHHPSAQPLKENSLTVAQLIVNDELSAGQYVYQWSFETKAYPVTNPRIIFPARNRWLHYESDGPTLDFEWTYDARIEYYILSFVPEHGMGNYEITLNPEDLIIHDGVACYSEEVTAADWDLLASLGCLEWIVTGVLPEGAPTERISSRKEFVNYAATDAPVLYSPIDFSIQETPPTFVWGSVAEASSYFLIVRSLHSTTEDHAPRSGDQNNVFVRQFPADVHSYPMMDTEWNSFSFGTLAWTVVPMSATGTGSNMMYQLEKVPATGECYSIDR